MATRTRSIAPFNAFMPWLNLYTKSMEMMTASAFVIPHRLGRMAAAGHTPDAVDRREFRLMGEEKVEAAMLSSWAMAPAMVQWSMQWWLMGMRQMMSVAGQMPALMSGRPLRYQPARARSDWAGHLRLAKLATRIASQGLAPVHAKATANARRLAKIKR